MGGPAAAGGFAYQHAQAVILALELGSDPALGSVRVEAENDVIDAELLSDAGDLVQGRQFKRKRSDDTWSKQDLVDELLRWSELAVDHPMATYEFVAEGRLGPTGRQVRSALAAARSGEFGEILALIGDHAPENFNVTTMARAEISIEEKSYLALIETAEEVAGSLLVNVSGEAEAVERGRWVVLELLNIVTHRSGLLDPAARLITRREVLELLSTPRDRIPTATWNDELKRAFVDSVLANAESMPVQLDCELDPGFSNLGADSDDHSGPRPLESWMGQDSVCLLGGASGSGKSTAVLAMQHRAAEAARVVLVADAEEYVPGRLSALAANALNAFSHVGAYPAVGNAALADPHVTLALDGVSEIDLETRQRLDAELKQLLSARVHAGLVLAGRDTTTMRKLLLRNTDAVVLQVKKPEPEQREKLVATTFQIDEEVAKHLVRRTRRAVGDLTDNPLMLLLGARAIATDSDPNNAAEVFHSVVRFIGTTNGYSDCSIYEVALGAAFSHLLQEGRRYCDSYEWSRLLTSVCEKMQQTGIEIDVAQLREFGSETGLIRRTPRDIVRPMHDSFADYLSALAIGRAAADYPERLSIQDRERIRLLAGITGVDSRTAILAATDLPFTASAIAPLERRAIDESWHEEASLLVTALLPDSTPAPNIAFWRDTSGRTIVTVGGAYDGWLMELAENPAESGWTFVLDETAGPLQVAVRIWHRHIDRALSEPFAAMTPVPRNLDESVQLLSDYSKQLFENVRRLIESIDAGDKESQMLADQASTRIQFLIRNTNNITEERDRGVEYREITTMKEGAAVLLGEEFSKLEWTGRGRVDSFIIQNPRQGAVKRVREAINNLVKRTWV